MEIISSKQEEEFKVTTFVINCILKLHTNPKVFMIQDFAWSFEILITDIQALTYSFYFDYIFSMSILFQ